MDISDGHCAQRFDWLGDAPAEVVAALPTTRADGHFATFTELDGPHGNQWTLALALCLLAGTLMGMQCATGVAEIDLSSFLVQAQGSQFVIGIDFRGEAIGEQDAISTRLVSYLPDGVVSFKIAPIKFAICQREVAVVALHVMLAAVLADEHRRTGRRLDGLFLHGAGEGEMQLGTKCIGLTLSHKG